MKIYRKILKNAAIGLSIILAATSFPAFEIDSFAEDTPSIAAALETDVLWGDVNKDGIVNSKDATDLAAAISKGTASAMLWADVSGDGKITNKDVGLINSYANEEIGYFPVGIFYAEGQVYTTKEMWIHNLVTTFNISVEDKSTMTEYFTDIRRCLHKSSQST